MKRLIKFLKRNTHFIAGIVYLGFVAVSFAFVLSFVARMINSSLPGGSQVEVPQLTFDIVGYSKIQDLVGIPLKEPEMRPEPAPEEISPLPETPPEEVTPEPEEVPVEEALPPVIDKSAVSLWVLNGSGVTGAAAKLRSALQFDGFKVSKVGNTTKMQKSKLEIKDSKKDYEIFIRAVIEKSYTIHEVVALDEGSEADAIFTIGLE